MNKGAKYLDYLHQLKNDLQNGSLWLELAEFLQEEEMFVMASRAFEKAFAILPDLYVRIQLGHSYVCAEVHKKGLAILEAVAREYPLVSSFIYLADAYWRLDRYKEAEGACLKALEIEPGFEEAHYHLGRVHHSLGAYDKAVECFRKAVSIDPDYQLAWSGLGHSLIRINLDEAIECLKRAIKLDAKDGLAVGFLGIALELKGEVALAEWYFKEMIETWPRYAPAYKVYGEFLERQGRVIEAKQQRGEFERLNALESAPCNAGQDLCRAFWELAAERTDETPVVKSTARDK